MRDAKPSDAVASCTVTHMDGRTAGYLAAWAASDVRPAGAAKVDSRAIDSAGGGAYISLVWAPPEGGLPFDDPVVCEAIRKAMTLSGIDILSTLSVGDAEFAGAVLGTLGSCRSGVDADPFAAIFPRRLLHADPGLLSPTPAPVGPGTQRYGADNPWPWDRF
jgi:hypothetical protein